ncbi:leucine-rich repeat domain-containing protein [Paenibacillus antri]|nr:leucine-rich repeat domain-containing protein [Paenibacillus antri]
MRRRTWYNWINRMLIFTLLVSGLTIPVAPDAANAEGAWENSVSVNATSDRLAVTWGPYIGEPTVVSYAVYGSGAVIGTVTETSFDYFPPEPGEYSIYVVAHLDNGATEYSQSTSVMFLPTFATYSGEVWPDETALNMGPGEDEAGLHVVLDWYGATLNADPSGMILIGYNVYYSTNYQASWTYLDFYKFPEAYITDPVPGVTDYRVEAVYRETSAGTFLESTDGPIHSFNSGEEPPMDAVTFPDSNMESAVRDALHAIGVYPAANITVTDLSALQNFHLPWGVGITDIEGIQYAANLSSISLSANPIADLPDMTGMANLQSFNAFGSPIDAGDLGNLPNLTYLLELTGTNVTDMSLVADAVNRMTIGSLMLRDLDMGDSGLQALLTGLSETSKNRISQLSLDNNYITDISSITPLSFPMLMDLNVSGNGISSIASLSGMTSIRTLNVSGNMIADIGALSGMTAMDYLYLSNNEISDISALSGMTMLRGAMLDGNPITNIEALTGLNKLERVDLDSTHITDLSPLVTNTGMNSGDVLFIQNIPGLDLVEGTGNANHIQTLKDRGVDVRHDAIAPAPPADTEPPLFNQQTLRVSGVAENQLTIHWEGAYDFNGVVEYRVSRDGSPIASLPGTAREFTDAAATPGVKHKYTVEAVDAANNWSRNAPTGIFKAHLPVAINNTDPAFIDRIRMITGKESGELTSADMMNLPATAYMYGGEGSKIVNLEGMQYAYSVTDLRLYNNAISDLSPLVGMPLNGLDLDNNLIADLGDLLDMYGAGAFQGEYALIYMYDNPLDLMEGSQAVADIATLKGYGIDVRHDPIVPFTGSAAPAIEASKTHVAAGDQFSVTVSVEDVPDLYGFEFELAYDKNVLELASVQANSEFRAGSSEIALMDIITPESTVRVVGSLQDAEAGLAPNGESVKLVDVYFNVLQPFQPHTNIALLHGKAKFSDSESARYVAVSDVVQTILPTVFPTTIAIEPNVDVLNMKQGDAGMALGYAFTPADTTNQAVTWSSDNESVVTVDADGRLTAVGPGTARVTVSSNQISTVSDSILIEVAAIDEAFDIQFSKEMVGPGEFVKATVSKLSLEHDARSFRIELEVAPFWNVLGVKPHADIASKLDGSLVLDVEPGYFWFGDTYIVSGELAEGQSIQGAANLFTIYAEAGDIFSDGPDFGGFSIESEPTSEPGGRLPLYFGITAAQTTDVEGIVHLLAEPADFYVPIVWPDVDQNPGVEVTDLVKVAKAFGTVVDWEISGEDGGYTPEQLLDFNEDGIVDLKDLTFVHIRVLISNAHFREIDPDRPDESVVPFPVPETV